MKQEEFLAELKVLFDKYQIMVTSVDGYNSNEEHCGTYHYLSGSDGDIYLEWGELIEELI